MTERTAPGPRLTGHDNRLVDIACVGIVAIVGLAAAQIIVEWALLPQYIDWFVHSDGYSSRAAAPKGTVAGVVLVVAVRSAFALAWAGSVRRILMLVDKQKTSSWWTLVIYAGIAVTGYGWLMLRGGLMPLTIIRCIQLLIGVAVLAVILAPRCRRWFTGSTESRQASAAAQPDSARTPSSGMTPRKYMELGKAGFMTLMAAITIVVSVFTQQYGYLGLAGMLAAIAIFFGWRMDKFSDNDE